ncbi:hypothetical protein CpecG_0663 [Chlamydia pecorum MC/MarsBar]|uniref:DNA-directed DNA polymerase n=1 Tax=Chlamydia pecorum TaxID=85991 RepID=A0AA40PQ22_9CHLA|nr:hypothetical protein [Chlamydia pecorum]AGW37897.1 hypothetical protein CPE1_0400 [Chlamydia pecorum PV3056/3]ETF37978.1 hypothetical protein CpecF_0664 [Chlamydia pecorum DBDeUG]ETF38246.1 hypothetical protein CpecG_0663 [Chlamydia pecorum MC/MarsBar]KTF28631.1 putative dNA polymerase III, delta subunit [Chlamydia pecorum]KZN26654.1 putative dNA polymerase III, delta subunit [Chlamydia pecorum]
MSAYLTDFDAFSQRYRESLPAIAVVGTASGEDREMFIELLVSGEYHDVDAQTLSVGALSQKTENYGLFATLETLGIFPAEKLTVATKEFLIGYSRAPLPHLKFLLITTKQAYFQELLKALPSALAVGLFGERAVEREQRLGALLSLRAERFGISCAPSLTRAFIKKLVDTSFCEICNEFDKLICHIGKKTSLEFSDIEGFIEKKERVSLWRLRDSLLQRHTETCLQQLHALLQEHGEDPLGIIAFLRTQCLYGLRGLEEKPEEGKFRLFVSYGKEQLYQVLSSLFYTESLIKNNLQDPIIAIETMIFRVTKL